MQRVLTVIAILLLMLGIMVPLLCEVKYDDGYKQGQIDALTGKICYKLEQQQDGSTMWIQIKNKHE
jgi:hypothetical protein